MPKYKSLLLLFAAGLLLTGCFSAPKDSPQPAFDIRGEWEYTMTASDGNTYDAGTITFGDEPAKGTYQQRNIYQVDYEGEFTVFGTTLTLTGDETWQGTLMDVNTIEGIWLHEDGTKGTFIARRK